jgi:phage-related protein
MADRTTNPDLIAQLMSYKTYTIILYDIELKDYGAASFSGTTMTDTSDIAKTWITNEWANDTSYLTDMNGNSYKILSNTATTVEIVIEIGDPTPANGDYSIHRWFNLVQHVETLDHSTGEYDLIEYGTDQFGRTKNYIPYPIEHKTLEETELGKFPQITLEMFNPGAEVIAKYYNLSDFDFFGHFERYKGLQGNTVLVTIAFIDNNGELITDTAVQLSTSFTIISSQLSSKTIRLILSSYGNLAEKKIPGRIFTKRVCSYIYKDTNCAFTSTYISPTEILDLPKCNKAFRTFAFGNENANMAIKKVDNFPTTKVYQLPATINAEDQTEFEESLYGCVVEYKSAPYLWRITNVDASADPIEITIDTFEDGGVTLYSVLSEDEQAETNPVAEVSIIEKECCIGHSDVGSKYIYGLNAFNQAKGPYCFPNDLVYNGDFSNIKHLNEIHSLDGWTITPESPAIQATNMSDGILLIDATNDQVEMTQTIYRRSEILQHVVSGAEEPLSVRSPRLLEHGKTLTFIVNHYSAAIESPSPAAVIDYRLKVTQVAWIPAPLPGHASFSYKYWDSSTKTWSSDNTTYNSIDIRPATQTLGLDIVTGADYSDFRFFKFDNYVENIPIINAFASTANPIHEVELKLRFTQVTSLLDYISVQLYNQFERYGGFPSIPTSKHWFV